MELRVARKKAGISQQKLAERIGSEAPNISAMESGRRGISAKMGEKLARALGNVQGAQLTVASQKVVLERAMKSGDPVGAIRATEEVVRATRHMDLTEADEKALNILVAMVVDFAKNFSSGGEAEESGETTKKFREDEGRDILGVKSKEPNRHLVDEESFYPLAPGNMHGPTLLGGYEVDDDSQYEEYDDLSRGHDAYGIRIAPLSGRDD